MKKFIKRGAIFLIPLVLFIVLTNYFIDPANLFSNKFEKELADILVNDKNAAGVYNYDERIFQKEYIEKIDEKNEVAVLGSSRSLQIREEMIAAAGFFNHGVSGAVLEDYIAITEIYRENDKLPEKIILGINPWIFNRYNVEERWRSIEEDYYSFFDQDYKKDEYLLEQKFGRNYGQLFSATYFQASFENLIKGQAFKDIQATDSESLAEPVKLADGSLVYQRPRKNISAEDAEIEAQNYIRNGVYSLENYSEMDDDYLQHFEQLIEFYLEEEIDLVFYLAPYHPLVFDYLDQNERYHIIYEVEEYIREFAEKNDIKVVGNYSPYELNLDKGDFHDGMHPKEAVMGKIFNAL
ncbi:MAG: hypothetical protein ABR547_02065 [Halanaerobium sp.]